MWELKFRLFSAMFDVKNQILDLNKHGLMWKYLDTTHNWRHRNQTVNWHFIEKNNIQYQY